MKIRKEEKKIFCRRESPEEREKMSMSKHSRTKLYNKGS